jgi:hypothetical protein
MKKKEIKLINDGLDVLLLVIAFIGLIIPLDGPVIEGVTLLIYIIKKVLEIIVNI